MKKIIDKLQERRVMTSLFFNKDKSDSPVVGQIVCHNDDDIILSTFAPNGMWDGYLMKKMCDLFKVEHDGLYEKKISTLAKVRGHSESKQSVTFSSDENLPEQLFQIGKTESRVVGIGITETDDILFGVINHFSEVISLQLIDEFGTPDGSSSVYFDEIDHIEVLSVECRSLELLKKNPKK